MKKAGLFLIFLVLLMGLMFAVQSESNDSEQKAKRIAEDIADITTTSIVGVMKMNEIVKETNKLRVRQENQSECPENCTCSGSTTKCDIDGGREMTILAGNSGNTIVQVKGENMSTNVTLYKSDGKLYAITKNNETKRINLLPDQIMERLQTKLQQRSQEYNITLDENGIYQIQTKKRTRFLFIFPTKEKVKVMIDPETGDITKTRSSWWGFLAKDVKDEGLLGESCGTVTPGYNDECCQNRGYNYWNTTKEECGFNSE